MIEAPALFDRHGNAVVASKVLTYKPAIGSGTFSTTRSCFRCGGVGGSEAWVATGWKCYNCGGVGKFAAVGKCYTAEKLAKLRATAERKEAARAAEAAAKRGAYLAEQAAIFDSWQAANAPAIDALYLGRGLDVSIVSEAIGKIDNRETISETHLDVALSIVIARLATVDIRNASTFVGTIGERIELELTVEKILDFSFGQFPTIYSYLQLCRDAAGNRIVYKGSKILADEGERVKVKATVAEHDEYKGERQTKIQRPKFID